MTPCRHFGVCGGCSLQDLSPEAYRTRKRDSVVAALVAVGLGNVTVEETILVPQKTRRRAVFKIAKNREAVEIGFHAQRSHDIVDMHECLVLTPSLLALADVLRQALAPIFNPGEKAELHVNESDTGFDLAFRCERKLTPVMTSMLAKALTGKGIARILFNGDVLMENAAPSITLHGSKLALPPQAFLQATREGEAMLQECVLALTGTAKNLADLFAGLGTFTLALARKAKVHAVEQDGAALSALAAAARATPGLKPVTTERRDLFKVPMTPAELKPFNAVVLDPPRAGALGQAKALAASQIVRIVYVSCDAASFARDAAILVEAGFRPGSVTPIDQFLYSGHIELVAGFERSRKL